MTPVADTWGAVLIGALSDGTHPVGGVAGNGGHLFGDQLWSAIIASPRHWLVSPPQAYDAHSTQHWTPEL
jgi:hypothetical protein